jgi:probable HAF family extracellular repeat protein
LSELQNPVSAPIIDAGGTTIQTVSYNVINLGTLSGGSYSSPNSMNNLGQVVGNANTTGSNSQAFLYSDGQMQDLGILPGGSFSVAYGINNLGSVVGESGNNSVIHAFLYSGGQMQDLGTSSATITVTR